MKFGRLHDTRFPNIDNVDVYAYKNEFDYSRWVAGTKIKLCNVLWNADYSDVARFETNIERDRWFDELDDYYTIELDSDRAYVPEQAIKIPVPYDVAARFNYMVVTIPVLPGSNPPINYENQETGIRRWYFFVNSMMTISAVSFLATMDNKPVSLMITQFEGQMQLECAALVSVIILFVNLVIKGIVFFAKRHMARR